MTSAEADELGRYRRAQRAAVLAIVEGLDDEQLNRSVVPSGWTPATMLRHLADVETHWFREVVEDRSPDPRPADVRLAYRQQARRSDRVWTGRSLDHPPAGRPEPAGALLAPTLRSVLLHVIEETARHAGHLDIARELLDGRTGLGPR